MFYKEAIGIVWEWKWALEHETYTGNQRERGTAGSGLPGWKHHGPEQRRKHTICNWESNLGETNRPNTTIFSSCGWQPLRLYALHGTSTEKRVFVLLCLSLTHPFLPSSHSVRVHTCSLSCILLLMPLLLWLYVSYPWKNGSMDRCCLCPVLILLAPSSPFFPFFFLCFFWLMLILLYTNPRQSSLSFSPVSILKCEPSCSFGLFFEYSSRGPNSKYPSGYIITFRVSFPKATEKEAKPWLPQEEKKPEKNCIAHGSSHIRPFWHS